MTNLTEQDREALLMALLCDEYQSTTEAQAEAVLEWADDVVRRTRAEQRETYAGIFRKFATMLFDADGPTNQRGAAFWDAAAWLTETAPGAQEPVLASNTRSVDLGDAGDVECAQNGADDGVRGGGA